MVENLPGPGFELSLNAVLHIVILWFALTGIFVLLISRTEKAALTNNTTNAIRTGLRKALNESNINSNGRVKTVLTEALPAIDILDDVYQGPDANTVTYNTGLQVLAGMIGLVFMTILITMLVTASAAGDLSVGRVFGYTLISNVILFLVVGAIEASFFELVATKFVPVKPSQISENAIADIKEVFRPAQITVTPSA